MLCGSIRIIPARAGQTCCGFYCCRPTVDHPRACGANGTSGLPKSTNTGSSPRVRGKLFDTVARRESFRIIPARAGQTHAAYENFARMPDHPRACGANSGGVGEQFHKRGSSPRVRGKLRHHHPDRRSERIIPARAGQTFPRHSATDLRSDHPRACGANPTQAIQIGGGFGSSPRVRGKPCGTRGGVSACRIIPARAGQTGGPSQRPRHRPDHPRACGANKTS